MFEQLKYKNHVNEVFEFGKDGIYVNMNDLHDYEWSVTSKGNRISALQRSVSTRKLPITIMCDTEENGIAARNKLLEICEKDVLAMQHGQIIIGDYYFKCFVTKSTKSDYIQSKRYMTLTLTLTTDFPYWVKEKLQSFGVVEEKGGDTLTWDGNIEGLASIDFGDGLILYKVSDSTPTLAEAQQGGRLCVGSDNVAFTNELVLQASEAIYAIGNINFIVVVLEDGAELMGQLTIPEKGVYFGFPDGFHISSLTINGYTGFGGGGSGGGSGLNYPFDYPFDYAAAIASTEINNTGFVASNFKIIIYGACSDPAINIGGHTYQVNCSVGDSEFLTIDSTTKKIYVTANDGTIINQFNNRNKLSYIFEKIPTGKNAITWSGGFGFDVILMEERSEPKWI